MNENTGKKLIAFTSQALKHQGIRAVRMDAIAHDMNMSKRTLYKVYKTKDNLINTCLASYTERTRNLFHIIRCNAPHALAYLLEMAQAFINNLYKATCIFWTDVTRHYRHIYQAIQAIWTAELEQSLLTCQAERFIRADLNRKEFLDSFTTLLYNARIAECPIEMLRYSARCMLRGIMTPAGMAATTTLPAAPSAHSPQPGTGTE